MKPVVYVLIGLPGSGKTTWRENLIAESGKDDIVIISQDDMIDAFAWQHNITYSEAFKIAPLHEFAKQARINFQEAITNRKSIVIDRTNMSKNTRASFLSQVPNEYEIIGVLFECDDELLQKRLKEREERTGKHIPPSVLESMRASFVPPDHSEFHKILYVRPSDDLDTIHIRDGIFQT